MLWQALPLLRRAAAMLHEQGHGRAGLASCLLKLAAALLKTTALADACKGAQRAGQDTSNAVIDMAM